MTKLLFALHLLFAIFTIGPLVHATTTASRAVRQGDATAATAAARTTRIYAYASVLTIIAGFALMSQKWHGEQIAEFSDTWIWLSLLLWLASVALALAVVVPGLRQAATRLAAGEPAKQYTARVAAAGGGIGVLLAVVVFLMVYRPGS